MKKIVGCIFALLFAVAMMVDGAYASAVTGVTIPAKLSADKGSTITMTAELQPADAEASVLWTSSQPKYATIDRVTGLVQARKMGRTLIVARAGGKSATCMLTITEPSATFVAFNRTSKTLNPGASFQLAAMLKPLYTSEKPVWASDNTAVADVTQDGIVTATASGDTVQTCIITATLKNNRQAKCRVTVKKIPETYVRMASQAVVPLYSQRPIAAAVYPLDAFDRTLRWRVVKNEAALEVVDARAGIFKGLKSGTAVIEARSSNGRYARCTVIIKMIRYSRFAVSPSSKVMLKGDTLTLTAKRLPEYVSYPNVTYTTSDSKVADVDATGLVTGVGRGYATITATADNGRVKDTTSIHVIDNDETLVTISAMGDIMLGGDPRNSTFNAFDKIWSANTPDYFFKNVKSAFSGLTVANFEIPLTNNTSIRQPWRNFLFRGKPVYADAIKGVIDVVDLDNNHIMDFGQSGFDSTRSVLRARGVSYFGRGYVSYRIENGVKIGFVGYRPEMISLSKMKENLRAVRKNCDILIASFHWGVSYAPNITQIKYGRAAIDAGADLVLGHHSHVVSGIEVYKSKYIVYGLGTIVAAVQLPEDTDAFIYKHTFAVSGNTVTNSGFEIVPIKMTANTKYNDAQPVLVDPNSAEGIEIIDKIKRYSPVSNPFNLKRVG